MNNLHCSSSTATLVIWLPGEVIINYTSAPVKRPMSATHAHWWGPARDQVLAQRQGFVERYPIQNPALKIVFVGQHQGMIHQLIHAVLNLLSYQDASRRPTLRSNLRMEDCTDLTILREPAGELGTGVRVEITVQQNEGP